MRAGLFLYDQTGLIESSGAIGAIGGVVMLIELAVLMPMMELYQWVK